MCTLVILRRPEHEWPVIIGANRDEMIDRPALPPGRHWPDRPEVVAGQDLLAGGTWLGVNDWGVVAAVLNRRGSLGPAAGMRSRGELVLEALDHADAVDAAMALRDLDPAAYRTFNLIVADDRDAFWLRHAGNRRIEALPIEDGLSVIANGEINDLTLPRLAVAHARFSKAPPPVPDLGEWSSWQALLSDDKPPPGATADAALRFSLTTGFATVSSALVGLPAQPSPDRPIVFRYAGWLPEATEWHTVGEV